VSPSDTTAGAVDPRLQEAEERLAAAKWRLQRIDGDIAANADKLGSGLQGLCVDVDSAVQEINARLEATLDSLKTERRNLEADFDKNRTVRRTLLSNDVLAAVTRARDASVELGLQRPAIPTVTMTESDLCPALSVRSFASVGTMRFPLATEILHQLPRLPALVPLVNLGHVIVEGTSDDPRVENLLTHLVAQVFTSAPGGQMVVTVFDPKMRSRLAGFQAHGAATEAKVLVNVHPSQEQLEKALAEHLEIMIAVGASTARQYANMGELVSATGQHEHQYHCLVILDAPAFWSERATRDLERIVDQGASAGISVILHHDPSEPWPRGIDFRKIAAGASQLRPGIGDAWTLEMPGVQRPTAITPPEGIPLSAQQRLMELVVGAAKEGVLPKVPFMELVERDPWWLDGDDQFRSTASGIAITLGRKGNQPVTFTLGDTVSNIHNVLVGGRAGSGKTVLLKAMIYSMAARYSPDELRLFLLDYKEGVEFQQFVATPGKETPLPHAEVISIESDSDFGLAVLRHFDAELRRRSEEFKRVGNVPNIAEYRRRTGYVMPRWVLLVDEFQGMFAGPSYSPATEALEDLVRRGRSFGLHVILASQTLSGIRFEGDKDKAIFENIPARIVLQLGPDEATKFLQPGNDAAAHLRYRGQAILNTHGGAIHDNQQFVVAFGDAEYLYLQEDLANAAAQLPADSDRNLRVYYGDRYISAASLLEGGFRPSQDEHGNLPAWYGQDTTVRALPASAQLSPTSGSNLLVLGSLDIPSAIATVQTSVFSAVAAQPDLQVLIFDSVAPPFRAKASIEQWITTLKDLGSNVQIFHDGDEGAFLESVQHAAREERRTVAVVVGAENSDFNAEIGEQWASIVRDLPRRGVHVIGQWSGLKDVPKEMYGGSDLVDDYRVIAFVGGDERLVEDATRRSRHDIPKMKQARTLVFTAATSQRGFGTVTSIQPLEDSDRRAWGALA